MVCVEKDLKDLLVQTPVDVTHKLAEGALSHTVHVPAKNVK